MIKQKSPPSSSPQISMPSIVVVMLSLNLVWELGFVGRAFRPIVGLIGGVGMAELHNDLNNRGGGVLGFWWGLEFVLICFRGGWSCHYFMLARVIVWVWPRLDWRCKLVLEWFGRVGNFVFWWWWFGLECVLAVTGDLVTCGGSFRLVWCLVVVEGLFCREGRQSWRTHSWVTQWGLWWFGIECCESMEGTGIC